MKPFRATLAALLLVATASTAYAGPLEDALAASKKSDYATALRLFRPLAEKGNVVAQSALGFMYETSEGVPQDYAEAAKWYRLAAAQGDAFAQTRFGYMYEIGVGVARDFAEAAKLFRLAAEQGRAVAQNELGDMYTSGRGVPQDYVAAYMWLQSRRRAERPRRGAAARSYRQADDCRTDRASAEAGARVETEIGAVALRRGRRGCPARFASARAD